MKIKVLMLFLFLALPTYVMAAGGKGMTWGFIMFSDIPAWPPGQTGVAKLGCHTPSAAAPYQCNPYQGDTSCSEARYILCVAETNNPYYQKIPPYNDPNSTNPATPYFNQPSPPSNRPPYKIHSGPAAMAKEAYSGWVDQPVKLTRYKHVGSTITSAAKGDQLCGNGWRMAEFHDGKVMPGMDYNVPSTYGNNWNPTRSGGWAFHAPLAADRNMGTDDHPANSGSNARVNFKNNRYWVKIKNQPANCWNP